MQNIGVTEENVKGLLKQCGQITECHKNELDRELIQVNKHITT